VRSAIAIQYNEADQLYRIMHNIVYTDDRYHKMAIVKIAIKETSIARIVMTKTKIPLMYYRLII